ncbi:MAG: uracil-DNA glycosylase [Verrucomicrobia bacterium]|nr:uracil-DNA glycosylase [Verrucomicrobiota bacterium]MBV8275913.1 uracil-DNA glycosylase [Verrucomicrobiota bacterium]
MSSFTQGLDILLQQLRSLDMANRPRFDQSLIDRIKGLKIEDVEEMPSRTSDSVEADYGSSVDAVREDARRVLAPEEPELAPSADREQRMAALREEVLVCIKCAHLAAFRHTVVFGVGNPSADLMFVGEAPGADEDLQGEPFVGRAGELLTRIIETMGFQRGDVYIANVLKCRPDMPKGSSGNRQPTPEEMQTCLPYLRAQIDIIKPKVMVALGGVAMRGLFGTSEPMKLLRGRWHSFGNIPVMATFHPSYLLRNQALTEKRKVWEDMLQVLERLQVPITQRQRNFFLSKA